MALCLVAIASAAQAEVTGVAIASRITVADGKPFGAVGPYEKLRGTIRFAIDPTDPRNARIADLDHAPRATDGRVHFSADLYVLRPVQPERGNGVLLFEIANRGQKGILSRFNRAPSRQDPTAPADFGDGLLMRDGYTIVWVGWQFDAAAGTLRVEAPAASVQGRVRTTFVPNEKQAEAAPGDLPPYRPIEGGQPGARLTVRDRFWEAPSPIESARWQLVGGGARVRVRLDEGFEPGRVYELDFPATGAYVAGVGLAAIRDAASAFRYRADMPVRGRTAYVFGISQSGRFLRQFLYDGFNADEKGRRVFDLVWPHIAGAGLGSFNERFAMPGYSSFPATRYPYLDLDDRGARSGLLAAYRREQMPKVIYTNTPVEYWGQGRAAALTHVTADGTRDAAVPDNVRIYLLSGTQHGEAAFPPSRGNGQALSNPTPQGNVLRALLRAAHEWVSSGRRPPDSRYPTLRNGTLVPVEAVSFPRIPRVADPRSIEGPARVDNGRVVPLPFLVPQVDADGNEIAGVRDPEAAVPLGTLTGWNFRSERVGNPSTIVALLGAYLPFARTAAAREAAQDPRPSIAERYPSRDDYLHRIRTAAEALRRDRLLLDEDVEPLMERARRHWDWAQSSGTN
jgi:hypothetical protein